MKAADGATVVADGLDEDLVTLEEVGATELDDGLAVVDVDHTPHELLLTTGAGAVPVGKTTVLFELHTDQTGAAEVVVLEVGAGVTTVVVFHAAH